jgi:hypothetical protein
MNTPGHRILAALRAAKQASPRMTDEEIVAIINRELPAAKPRQKKPIASMTDEEFIEWLEAEPALAGVDIKQEIGKCQFWSRANNVQPTRRRIINWLNNPRTPRVLQQDMQGRTSMAKPNGVPRPVADWKARLDEDFPGNNMGGSWDYLYKNYPEIAKKYL